MAGVREDWFPTSVWRFDHPEPSTLNRQLLKLTEAEKLRDPDGRSGRSNVQGWQSQDDLFRRPEWAELAGFAEACVAEVVAFNRWDRARVQPFISNAWAFVNGKNATGAAHVHPQAFLSGVYYIQAEPTAGHLYFLDPRTVVTMTSLPLTEVTPWSFAKVYYEPRPGRLLLFPSWLYHGVEANLSERDRVSVSFNVGVRWL